MHLRVAGGKAVCGGMIRDLRQPQRLGVIDQNPEDPAASRQVADRLASLPVHARGQEL